MIRLESRPKAPGFFQEEQYVALARRTASFYAIAERKRRQHRYDFPLLPRRMFNDTLAALLAWTSGKCAYCETPIQHPGNASLDRFRPKAGALDADGKFSTEHYWWLAFEWRNLYPSCVPCNKAKGPKFPMQGPRVSPETPYEQLSSETRLLLDPAYDDPESHLAFWHDGNVMPQSVQGEATIVALELNRSSLVQARRAVATRVRHLLDHNDHAAQVIARWGSDWRELLSEELKSGHDVDEAFLALAQDVEDEAVHAAVGRAMVEQFIYDSGEAAIGGIAARMGRKRSATPARAISPAPAHVSALHSQIITRIQVKNFRGVSELDLPIDFSVGGGAPWTVLLGENGAGKSSILQAIALTLLNSDTHMPRIKPEQVLRKGAASGYVRVWFHGSKDPRELSFRKRARRFTRKGPPYSGTLLGYGATRLLPRTHVRDEPRPVRLDNLFDPFRPLIDADHWLGALAGKEFDFVARALRDVLDLPGNATLRRARTRGERKVKLKQYGADLTLQDLSDGYQSTLGLTCDVISCLPELRHGALDASEAIVLIDELGAHLHPRWRMRIVGSLRRAFTRVQFIASTHDPLCLRGLENGEAVVLRRSQRGKVYRVPGLPPVKGLRVDQLLTSEFFGLDSTLDPSIESSYRELYRLLAIRYPTPKIETRIAELREELAPYDLPGVTRRERRLLEVIDRELAQLDATADQASREQIREENEAIISDLLRTTSAGGAGA